jgi:hypothetical protein
MNSRGQFYVSPACVEYDLLSEQAICTASLGGNVEQFDDVKDFEW